MGSRQFYQLGRLSASVRTNAIIEIVPAAMNITSNLNRHGKTNHFARGERIVFAKRGHAEHHNGHPSARKADETLLLQSRPDEPWPDSTISRAGASSLSACLFPTHGQHLKRVSKCSK